MQYTESTTPVNTPDRKKVGRQLHYISAKRPVMRFKNPDARKLQTGSGYYSSVIIKDNIRKFRVGIKVLVSGIVACTVQK